MHFVSCQLAFEFCSTQNLFWKGYINSLESLKQGISLPQTLPAEKSVLSDRLLALQA